MCIDMESNACSGFFQKAWTAIDRLLIIWKSDLTDKIKRSFFKAAVVSILLYGCTTWTLTKRLEKKLDGNYTRILRAILNRSWQQHPTRRQLYGHLPPITKTIQARRTRHAGHCWRSKDEIVSDVLLWSPHMANQKPLLVISCQIYFYTYHHHHHHHHVVLLARISLTLSRHFSLSFIASGRSSGLHPVSSHSSCMYVRAGRPSFARPCEGVHRSISLMSLSLLLPQCTACLVRLILIVFVVGEWLVAV